MAKNNDVEAAKKLLMKKGYRVQVPKDELVIVSYKVPKDVAEAFKAAIRATPGLRIQDAAEEALRDWCNKKKK